MELKEAEVQLTYRNKKTGETFKDRKDWEAKGYTNEGMEQEVQGNMPPLDLLSKT